MGNYGKLTKGLILLIIENSLTIFTFRFYFIRMLVVGSYGRLRILFAIIVQSGSLTVEKKKSIIAREHYLT